ncbi:DUF6279 family lipoprotein [Hydrogenophaga sp. 5NK40-0174]|uniref:DUF6279 family lipoprotein n=1 Tax=Hydrogenophaga sp. 5NK40-0174 TaxID=3127649 RepID=UPI0033429B86
MLRVLPCIIPGWQAAARSLVLFATATLLVACSAVGLAYRQSTTALYWWLDAQLDLNDAQSTQVRRELDTIYEWHRRQELPRYLGTLDRWQTMAMSDLDATQACAEFAQVRGAMEGFTTHISPALARLVQTLTPAQIAHLKKHQARSNEEYAERTLQGSAKERAERHLERLTERYERLYGPLNAQQTRTLKEEVLRSSFDAQRSYDERVRRQEALRDVFRQVMALPRTPDGEAQAVSLLRQWFAQAWHSPTPGYQAYANTLIRQGCEQFAQVHRHASAEQRQHGVQVLQSYEMSLRDFLPRD